YGVSFSLANFLAISSETSAFLVMYPSQVEVTVRWAATEDLPVVRTITHRQCGTTAIVAAAVQARDPIHCVAPCEPGLYRRLFCSISFLRHGFSGSEVALPLSTTR
ncbi:MAG: hypothetical protein ACREQZ_04655, partial [Woeseiaceae bacterium]